MKMRTYIPAISALAALLFGAVLLTYEHVHGGVRSHHLLNQADLPAISNGYGLIVLPVLGWLFGLRLRARPASSPPARLRIAIAAGFAGGLLYGVALAACFALDAAATTNDLFFGLFVFAVVLPIYRIECIFGFVLGMAFTFGAVLPTLVAAVFAALSALVRACLRVLVRLVRPAARHPVERIPVE